MHQARHTIPKILNKSNGSRAFWEKQNYFSVLVYTQTYGHFEGIIFD